MKKNGPDAIDLLDADHLAVHALFQAYAGLVREQAPALQRRTLAEEICLELTIHARLEEELFHPAVREALHDDEPVDASEDEHAALRDAVAGILASTPEAPGYDGHVAALATLVERHVRSEREDLFNRVLASPLDLHALGRSISIRREELRSVADALREDALAAAIA